MLFLIFTALNYFGRLLPDDKIDLLVLKRRMDQRVQDNNVKQLTAALQEFIGVEQ